MLAFRLTNLIALNIKTSPRNVHEKIKTWLDWLLIGTNFAILFLLWWNCELCSIVFPDMLGNYQVFNKYPVPYQDIRAEQTRSSVRPWR
jgi:hypothetical protein